MRTWCQSIENLGAPPWCEELYSNLTWGLDVHQVFAYLIEEILHKILLKNTIPFLEESTLDISFVFLDLVVEIPGNLNLEKFTLNVVTENGCFNGFFQKLSQIAPNLKKLVINIFCGVWDMDKYQYNLDLTVCSLETLKIDILPVKQKTEQCVEQETTTQADGGGFVLEVCSLREQNISVYKVSFDFSRLNRANKSELQRNFVQVEDYISVKISKHKRYISVASSIC